MRLLLLLVVVVVVTGCASPCENLNAEQDDPAMQTCVFSASLDAAGAGGLTTADGSPVAFSIPAIAPAHEPVTLPDGTRLEESYFGLSWSGTGGDLSPADSASGVSGYTVAPDGAFYALGMATGGRVLVVDAAGTQLVEMRVADGVDALIGRSNRASHLAISPDGSRLMVGDALRNVTAWDVGTGAALWTADVGEGLSSSDGLRTVAFSPNGGRVGAATQRAALVWDTESGDEVAHWALPGKTTVTGLFFSPDGDFVAVRKAGRYNARNTRVTTRDDDGSALGYARTEENGAKQSTPTVAVLGIP